jgi:hypothetical protein
MDSRIETDSRWQGATIALNFGDRQVTHTRADTIHPYEVSKR